MHTHFTVIGFGLFQAINIFGDKRNKEAAEKLAKEQELQKIHVKKEDIEVIVSVVRDYRNDLENKLDVLLIK